MNYKEAKTEANFKANLTRVNHVIVNIDSIYNVYSEKEYPKGYLELVKPVAKEVKIKAKKQSDVSEEA